MLQAKALCKTSQACHRRTDIAAAFLYFRLVVAEREDAGHPLSDSADQNCPCFRVRPSSFLQGRVALASV